MKCFLSQKIILAIIRSKRYIPFGFVSIVRYTHKIQLQNLKSCKKNMIGCYPSNRGRYDLMSVVLVCLADELADTAEDAYGDFPEYTE